MLTAEELIEQLQKIPKDTEIKINILEESYGFEYPVEKVQYYPSCRTPSSVGGWVFSKVFIMYI
jgi:hypothetical protein